MIPIMNWLERQEAKVLAETGMTSEENIRAHSEEYREILGMSGEEWLAQLHDVHAA